MIWRRFAGEWFTSGRIERFWLLNHHHVGNRWLFNCEFLLTYEASKLQDWKVHFTTVLIELEKSIQKLQYFFIVLQEIYWSVIFVNYNALITVRKIHHFTCSTIDVRGIKKSFFFNGDVRTKAENYFFNYGFSWKSSEFRYGFFKDQWWSI